MVRVNCRPLKNAVVAFFNLAKCGAKLRTARKITTCVAILSSRPCDVAARRIIQRAAWLPLIAAPAGSPRLNVRRRGASRSSVVVALVAVLAVAGLAFWLLPIFKGSSASGEWLTQRATKGIFTHDVVERGELESSSNVEIRCEVQSRNAAGTGVKIIQIVPEGTVVKPGDFLVKFDDSALQGELTTQQIAVSTAEAAAAQAQSELESAEFAKQEYEFGTYGQEEEELKSELLVAKENLSRAEESFRFSERLARRGYITTTQLQGERFAIEKARTDLKIAHKKLEVLEKFVRVKTLKQQDADIRTAKAKVKSEEAKLALETQKLQLIERQISKCQINAPIGGQVVYDHEFESFRGAEYQIKEGTIVNERRVLIRLPDPKRMQVVAKVAESRIDLIKVGMLATLEIEGLPGAELTGKVTKVNEYPASGNWFNANVKEYATTIEVDSPPDALRPGMTSKVAIRVETSPDALQVPIQSVVERGGKHYCLLVRDGTDLEAREVLIGSTNEKFLIIRDGLLNNDEVLMNPRVFLTKVHLPEVEEKTPAKVAAKLAAQNEKVGKSTSPPARATAGGPGS